MSYTPTTWANGDTITAEKMNNIEQGIVNASSGGGGLVVHETLETVDGDEKYVLDKTYNEILASFSSGASVVIITEYGEVCSVLECYPAGDEFVVVGFYEPVNKYFAFNGDDYPSARAS